MRHVLALVLGCLLNHGVVQAQSDAPVPANASALVDNPLDNPEFGGVVTAEVLTSMGHLFHAKFTENWQNLENADQFNVLVKERPYRTGSTAIQVMYGTQVVYRRNLPNNYSLTTQLAVEAAEAVHQQIISLNLQARLFKDLDMAPSGY